MVTSLIKSLVYYNRGILLFSKSSRVTVININIST